MDELPDTDSDADVKPIALTIPPVEIAPFPDFNNLQQMVPHEIQVEDLLGFDGVADNNNPAPKNLHQNIQIGMVQIVQPSPDIIFGNLSPLGSLPPLGQSPKAAVWTQAPLGPSPEAIRYWVKFSLNTFMPLTQFLSLMLG